MRNKFAIAAVVAAVGATSAAHAQDNTIDVAPSNIAVRLGVVLPLDSALQHVGNPLIGFGAEYEFNRSFLGSGGSYLSIDYFTPNLKFEKGSVFPICLNQRFYLKQEARGHRTYAFLGVGVAVVDVNTSNTVVAARGGLGVELGDAIYFETAAVVSDKADTATADSVGFYIGYRF